MFVKGCRQRETEDWVVALGKQNAEKVCVELDGILGDYWPTCCVVVLVSREQNVRLIDRLRRKG